MNTPGTMTKIGAATHLLAGMGAPINQHTVGSMLGWFNAEGGNWGNTAAYNPLNTTLNAPGARAINSAGVKAYGNWGQGLSATLQTLKQPNMRGIVQAFHSSNPDAIAQAIGESPWGTDANLVRQTISSATGQRYGIPAMRAAAVTAAREHGPGIQTPSVTNAGPSQSVNWPAALRQAMLNSSASSVTSVHGGDLLSQAENLVNQGGYTTTKNPSTVLKLGPAAHAKTLRAGAFHNGLGKGDVNPLGPGWTYGRTDMGVDANAAPGTPIRAVNDSKVVDIQHNWYQGQPLVLMQLTSGPNAGKYWYVAEQINAPVHVGQFIPKGHIVATYANNGTGIEIGWGHPGGGDTLAQAQGNTGGPSHSNSPAGENFRSTVLSLPRR